MGCLFSMGAYYPDFMVWYIIDRENSFLLRKAMYDSSFVPRPHPAFRHLLFGLLVCMWRESGRQYAITLYYLAGPLCFSPDEVFSGLLEGSLVHEELCLEPPNFVLMLKPHLLQLPFQPTDFLFLLLL